MKYFLFEGPITLESADKLIYWICSNEGELAISLDSHGGDTFYAALIKRCLHENKERITLIAGVIVLSTAFEIFRSFAGNSHCKGMYHKCYQAISVDGSNKTVDSSNACSQRNLKHLVKRDMQIAESFMNKTEMNKFKRGDDVFFDFDRMKQIFPDVEVIF